MNVPGSRPDAVAVERGVFDSMTVYLKGDTVVDQNGHRWRAVADFRSGYLEPSLVAKDRPGQFWVSTG